MATGPATTARVRRGNWLEWLLAITLLLVVFGNFVVRPLAERFVAGVLGGVGAVLSQLAEAVREPYAAACLRIEQGFDTRALFGEAIVCAPLEDAQWIDPPHTPDTLEFFVAISGPLGAGQARVITSTGNARLEPIRIEVTAPSGEVVELLAP